MGPYAGFPIHAFLGLLMAIVALSNAKSLGALSVPDRLKRISKVTAGLACLQLIVGVAMGALAHLAPRLPFAAPVLQGIHIVCALAILSQASSVATSYDMWEEREFGTIPKDVQA
jgi:heme A synthase